MPLEASTLDILAANSGSKGSEYIGDTSAKTGDWFAIQALTDVTFTLLTGNCDGGASMTLPAGHILFGKFTAITLAGGTAVAYKAS